MTEALAGHHHEVIAVGIDKSGGWHLCTVDGSSPLRVEGPPVLFLTPGGRLSLESGELIEVDVVFPVLHGPYGEDGTVQGLFEMAGLPFVGAGVLSSAIGMDKDVAKRLFVESGLPVTPGMTVRHGEFNDSPGDVVERVLEGVGLPAFVKPAALGSSVGITRVDDAEALKPALQLAFEHGAKVLVEEAIAAREIEVAVLDGPRTSVPGEIVPPEGNWYDYESKYQDDGTTLHVPAPLDAAQTAQVQALAGKAFEVLECQGLARVDFFLDDERGFLINEVNTMPGMTSRSMFPLLWEATGVKYADLVDGLVSAAFDRR